MSDSSDTESEGSAHFYRGDLITSEQLFRIVDVYRECTKLDDNDINATVLRFRQVMERYAPSSLKVMDGLDFKDGVNRSDFFMKIIKVIAGAQVDVNITRLASDIIHFTWHFGEHDNVYRFKCIINRSQVNYTHEWDFERIDDNHHTEMSEGKTDSWGMDSWGMNNDRTASDLTSEDELSSYDGQSDDGSLNQKLSKHPNANEIILSALVSMHQRLCKLGV